ncbi:DNA polymerase III subunit chi [Enterovirga aerilata]|uniref:DNA polymerase III subunit chi n=1 Tax=Enterovirga aerilata TaxID=2730920 RepID=A0A849HZT9_9HYPH|nr:DNA polymerase III subunit chi [Enterovirga sp. DB1703]NNM72602.1 DNA polymerase III subunit chi [Enterovirga sp. DB1703]
MSEVFFYHLQRQPLEAVLPRLLDKSRERGWRALVRVGAEERLAALDDHLWTYADESFLPHGTDREPDPEEHPVLLTTGDRNRNGAAILFLVAGAAVPADISAFQRVMYLLDGSDEEAVQAGREAFRLLREAGHELSYWQQDGEGRWAKRG